MYKSSETTIRWKKNLMSFRARQEANASNPSTWEMIQRISVQGQPGQKVSESPISIKQNKMLRAGGSCPNSRYLRGWDWSILAGDQPKQIVCETSSPKWTGGVALMVECLLGRCEALSSNTSPTTHTKKPKTKPKPKLASLQVDITTCTMMGRR
jgi:hypothetical protein